jgi:hypothetical protein
MGHMGNSGKTAIGAFTAAAGLLVLTATTLEEAALAGCLGAVAVGYVASVAESFARRRYLALLAGGAGTSLFIGCSIAFLRMWGLAFNQDAAALGQAVTSRDSDIYFYLAGASGMLTLLVLFCSAVWPSRRRTRHTGAAGTARPAGTAMSRSTSPARAARRPAAAPARAAQPPARPAAKLPAGARQPALSTRQPAQGTVRRQPVQQKPAPNTRQPAQRTTAPRPDARSPRRR